MISNTIRLSELGEQQLPALLHNVPYCKHLGLHYEGFDADAAVMSLPSFPYLIGDTHKNILHGGAITALVDTCSALIVMAQLQVLDGIATLDLRIDYASAALPGQKVYCKAICYKLSESIAFTRAICYHEQQENYPIAQGVATFMHNAVLGSYLDLSDWFNNS